MAQDALTADTAYQTKNKGAMTRINKTMISDEDTFAGALLVVNTSGTAQAPTDSTTTHFLGMAEATAASGAAVNIVNNLWAYLPIATAGISVGNVGDACYCSTTDSCVTAVSTHGPPCGEIKEFSASGTHAWIALGFPALGNAS